jgi:hypothetical protein
MQEEGGCMQGEDRYMQEDGVGACKETAGAGREEVVAFSEWEGCMQEYRVGAFREMAGACRRLR